MAYTDTPNMPLHMPTPGTREPAQISLLNENCVVLANHDHTTGKGLAMGRLRSGLAANRPAPSTAGNVYFSTDTGIFNVDTGTAWVQFLTSGGAATVTGWTLIDPIIRNVLQFGPQGGSAIDASITRTAANVLQLNNYLSVGAAAYSWGANHRVVQIGGGGALLADATVGSLFAANNTYFDGTAWKAMGGSATGASYLQFDGTGAIYFQTAPQVAADAAQTFTQRLSVTRVGTLTLNPAVDTIGLMVQASTTSTTGANPVVRIARSSAATQSQWISFAGGISYGDYFIGRRVNDDNLYFSAWNGVTLVDRMKLQTDGTLVLNSGSAGSGAILFNAAGIPEQRYMLSTAYQSDLTVQDVIRNGPVVLRIARATNTLTLTPNNGSAAIDFQASPSSIITAASTLILRSTANIHVNPSGTIFGPETDGVCNLGYSNVRWAQIWSTITSISASHVSQKHGFAPLDPAACVDAVLNTDWLSFDFNDPPKPDPTLPEDYPEREQRLAEMDAAYQKMLEETKPGRQQKGYVLGSDQYKTADLFGQSDRYSASTHADLAVVACALQAALKRIADLEARNAAAA